MLRLYVLVGSCARAVIRLVCPTPPSMECGGVWFVLGVEVTVKPQSICLGCSVLELLLFVGVQQFECQTSVNLQKKYKRGAVNQVPFSVGLPGVWGSPYSYTSRRARRKSTSFPDPAFLLSNTGTKVSTFLSGFFPLLDSRAFRFLLEVPASIGQFCQTKNSPGKQTSRRKHAGNESRASRLLLA